MENTWTTQKVFTEMVLPFCVGAAIGTAIVTYWFW